MCIPYSIWYCPVVCLISRPSVACAVVCLSAVVFCVFDTAFAAFAALLFVGVTFAANVAAASVVVAAAVVCVILNVASGHLKDKLHQCWRWNKVANQKKKKKRKKNEERNT